MRHNYGKSWWTLPGGRIKKHETPEEAVRREMKEELGVEIISPARIGQFLYTSEYKRDTIVCFAAKIKDKRISSDRREILEARWCPRENLPQPFSPIAARILGMWQQREDKD